MIYRIFLLVTTIILLVVVYDTNLQVRHSKENTDMLVKTMSLILTDNADGI